MSDGDRMAQHPVPPELNPKGDAGHAEDSTKNTFLGVTLKGWAISAISLIAVLTAVGTGSFTVYGKYESVNAELASHKAKDASIIAQNSVLESQLQKVTDVTKKKLTEAQKHINSRDRFERNTIENSPEIVTADFYPSDGCIHISRTQPPQQIPNHKSKDEVHYGSEQDIWIPDPNFNFNSGSVKTDPSLNSSATTTEQLTPSEITDPLRNAKNTKKISNSSSSSPSLLKKAGMFQGTCLNPHPGYFQVQNVPVNACEVQVWRRFVDGCTHYQMYNACTGQWAPGVVWTFCVVQHRW